jgi:2-amino-4-hydroxy-6-hydroxymethyldihydropteridine diphosphokinase
MTAAGGAQAASVDAFVALGANLGNPAGQLQDAFAAIDALPRTRLVARSALYRTAPVGGPPQPDYLNAVAHIRTTLSARALLDALLDIERAAGRVRAERNGPRVLDLDLILYGAGRTSEPGLEVPHPRLHERAFVLAPLAEIAPEHLVPDRGRVRDLLAALAGQRIERAA